jgi:hypothetical protein
MSPSSPRRFQNLLRSPRLWALVAPNALNMSVYSLWTNWTTLYLVEAHRLTLAEANWYAVDPSAGRHAGRIRRRLAFAAVDARGLAGGGRAHASLPGRGAAGAADRS